jgi:phage tail-like protein
LFQAINLDVGAKAPYSFIYCIGYKMARSTAQDPIEKFRFRMTMLNITASPGGLIQNFTSSVFLRSGFTSVTLPKKTTKELPYRECGDPEQMRKQPGLTTYSDCTLRRGSTENQDFYRWSQLVKGDTQFQATMAEAAGALGINTQQYPTSDATDYRKDIIIDVIGHSNAIRKSWYLYNCWVKNFNPGDLDAQQEQQLIEEITICCEIMSEVSADKAEANRVLLAEVGAATLNQLVPGLGSELQGGF